MKTYYLETHPTGDQRKPLGVVEWIDGKPTRVVAIFHGDAHATLEEARTMVEALNDAEMGKS